jgi:hypothetical protein
LKGGDLTEPHLGKGTPLQQLMDHKKGGHTENRPETRQRLCAPGTALHDESRGGTTTGLPEQAAGGLVKVDRNGTRHDGLLAAPGWYTTFAGGKWPNQSLQRTRWPAPLNSGVRLLMKQSGWSFPDGQLISRLGS